MHILKFTQNTAGTRSGVFPSASVTYTNLLTWDKISNLLSWQNRQNHLKKKLLTQEHNKSLFSFQSNNYLVNIQISTPRFFFFKFILLKERKNKNLMGKVVN